jgi:hypothetical protein
MKESEMPFEWRAWISHVQTLLQRVLTGDERERARDLFFEHECPTHAAHVIHYQPAKP